MRYLIVTLNQHCTLCFYSVEAENMEAALEYAKVNVFRDELFIDIKYPCGIIREEGYDTVTGTGTLDTPAWDYGAITRGDLMKCMRYMDRK
jgi:uncharacterized protein (DUF433 family)